MTALEKLIRPLNTFNGFFTGIGRNVGMTLVALMTAIILIQVFFRYVLGNALSWSEEIARFMMVWLTFLIAPVAYHKGLNVSMDTVSSLFKGRFGTIVQLVVNLLIMAMVMVLLWKSFGMIERGMNLRASTVNIKVAFIYLVMPIGFSLMLTVGLEHLLNNIRDFFDPAGAEARRAAEAAKDEKASGTDE